MLLVAVEQKLPAVTVSLTNATAPSLFQRLLITTPPIAASATTTTVGATANVPARLYTWQDEDGEPRSALMLDQSADRAGVLRQISYRVAGTNRVCSAIPSNGDEIQGMGYVENHLGTGGDNWTAGVSTNIGGTTKLVFAGRHHAIIQYTIPNYTLNGKVIYTCVQWMFATGRSHPLFCVIQDARAYTAGNLGSDSRSPYGTLNIAGDGRNLPSQDYLIGGVSWGDTYKFVSVEPNTTNESTTLLAASGWQYQEQNTIPYTMAWLTGANAEQGTVATTPIANQDQGSDPRIYPATGFQKNTQSLSGPMIQGDDWAYQMMNYPDVPTDGTTDTKMAWGMNFGALGGFDNWWPDGGLNPAEYSCHRDSSTPWTGSRTNGLFLSYSTFIVLGEHTGGYRGGATGKMVAQMENHQSATLSAQTGRVITQGPASRSISNSPVIAYSPAGYDPVYATWNAAAATNSAISLTLAPAAGKSLCNPVFHISDYQSTNPPSVHIDGELAYPDADYFASVDAVNHELWLTLNRIVSNPCSITLDSGFVGVVGPLITANGLVGDVQLNRGNPVTIAVQMMNIEPYIGVPVDWWVVALAGSSWYYLNNPGQWLQFDGNLLNCHPVCQGGLFDLPATQVLSMTGLPIGSYTFWFAVDYPMDGILNMNGPILYDSVNVLVQ